MYLLVDRGRQHIQSIWDKQMRRVMWSSFEDNLCHLMGSGVQRLREASRRDQTLESLTASSRTGTGTPRAGAGTRAAAAASAAHTASTAGGLRWGIGHVCHLTGEVL